MVIMLLALLVLIGAKTDLNNDVQNRKIAMSLESVLLKDRYLASFRVDSNATIIARCDIPWNTVPLRILRTEIPHNYRVTRYDIIF